MDPFQKPKSPKKTRISKTLLPDNFVSAGLSDPAFIQQQRQFSVDSDDAELVKLEGLPNCPDEAKTEENTTHPDVPTSKKKNFFTNFSIPPGFPPNLSPRSRFRKSRDVSREIKAQEEDQELVRERLREAPPEEPTIQEECLAPLQQEAVVCLPEPLAPPNIEKMISENKDAEKKDHVSIFWKICLWLLAPFIFLVSKFMDLFKKNEAFVRATCPETAPLEVPITVQEQMHPSSDIRFEPSLDDLANQPIAKIRTSYGLR
jgi:hypothetical protein